MRTRVFGIAVAFIGLVLSAAPSGAVVWKVEVTEAVKVDELPDADTTSFTINHYRAGEGRMFLVVRGTAVGEGWAANDKVVDLLTEKRVKVVADGQTYFPSLEVDKPWAADDSISMRVRDTPTPFALVFLVPASFKAGTFELADRSIPIEAKAVEALPRPSDYADFTVTDTRWQTIEPMPARTPTGAAEQTVAPGRRMLAVTLRVTPKRAMPTAFANSDTRWVAYATDLSLSVGWPGGGDGADTPPEVYLAVLGEWFANTNRPSFTGSTALSASFTDGAWRQGASRTYLFAVPAGAEKISLCFRMDRVAEVPVPPAPKP